MCIVSILLQKHEEKIPNMISYTARKSTLNMFSLQTGKKSFWKTPARLLNVETPKSRLWLRGSDIWQENWGKKKRMSDDAVLPQQLKEIIRCVTLKCFSESSNRSCLVEV